MSIRFHLKNIFFLWLVLAGAQPILAAAATPPAQEDQRSQNYRLNTLFKLSGLKNVLANTESIVQKSNHIREDALLPGQGDFAREIMRKAYSSGKFYYALRQPFKKDYKPQHVRAATQWYRSALGKKILRLETEANDPVNRIELEEFVRNIMHSPPDEERIRLVERVERSAHVTKAGKTLYLGYVKLMLPFNKNFEGKESRKVMRSLEKSITEPMREVVLRSLLFSYRNLKDKEIEKYAEFLNSESGWWFNQMLINGFKKATQKALYKAGLIQVELIEEIESGGPEYPLLRDIAPPGQRYMLIGKRDPFQPLVNRNGLIELTEVKPSRSEARLFGGELKDIPPIALPVFSKIENKYPKLYRELKHFERLFKNQEALEEMDDEEYAQVVGDYRDALERSLDIRMDESPLQVDYNSIRMTGIIQKKKEAVAMFEIDTTGYAVKKGDRVGPFFGYVKDIQSNQVIVIEEHRDYLGNILTNKKVIQFSQSAPGEGNTNS
ncbi:MAG: pilus assembly protein PilP [Nitrospinae bacterium]|nr:pilus assembly protein PilP [Nitrospinota bacterium]